MAEKISTLLRPFKQVYEGRWVQVSLSDNELIEEFKKSHQEVLPYVDNQSEKLLFLSCFLNYQGYFKYLEKQQGPFQHWNLLGLFKIQKPETIVSLIKIRSTYLSRLNNCAEKIPNWWKYLYEILPSCPEAVCRDLLESISEKDFDFIHCYIKINVSIGLVIEEIKLEKFRLLELSHLVMTLLKQNFTDAKFVNMAKNQLNQSTLQLSIDSWMKLTEISTHDLSSNIWWHDENFPSNHQLLVAHYCHEIIQLLNCPKDNELKDHLSHFARKYHREFELDLENLSYNDIVLQLKKTDVEEEWKIEAFVGQLMKCHLQEFIKQDYETQKEILNVHSIQYLKYLETLHQHVSNPEVLIPVLRVANAEMVKIILEKELMKERLPIQKTPTNQLECDLRSFINKSSDGQDLDQVVEWFVLVFINPTYVVESLIFEAVNHPGKIKFASELLIQLPCKTRFSIPEICLGYFMSNDDIRDNASVFIITLCDKEPIFADRVWKELLKLMTQTGDLLICCLRILTSIRQNVTIFDDSHFVQIHEILEQKKERTIWDGMILDMIAELTNVTTKVQPAWDTSLMLDLPWLGTIQWSSIPSDSLVDILEDILIVLDLLSPKHQNYILQQLSRKLAASSDLLSIEDLNNIHVKIILLLQKYYHLESLQNCQIQILAKILENEPIDFAHLTSLFSTLPECDAKKLSLTKLQLILDLKL